MAKINIEVDTSKKTITAKIDGTEVEGLANIWIDADNPLIDFSEFSISISSLEDAGDMKKVTRLVANEKGEMVVRTNSDVAKDAISSLCQLK